MKFPKLAAVIGGGQMGCGITELLVRNGVPTLLLDLNDSVLQQSVQRIKRSIARVKDLSETEKEKSMSHISPTTDWTNLREVELVIEAVTENEQVKKDIFTKCDTMVPENGILATNTSAISITRLSNYTSRPSQVIGMHFMNPAPQMKLIELIKGLETSNQTYKEIKAFAESLGKITCMSNDRPGFIVNRILMPMINEAFFALMEGVSTAEEIDKGMKHGTNQPLGPLALADFIGLDVCVAICNVLHEGLRDDKYRFLLVRQRGINLSSRPCPLMKEYVDAGHFGRKTGRGVFQYRSR